MPGWAISQDAKPPVIGGPAAEVRPQRSLRRIGLPPIAIACVFRVTRLDPQTAHPKCHRHGDRLNGATVNRNRRSVRARAVAFDFFNFSEGEGEGGSAAFFLKRRKQRRS